MIRVPALCHQFPLQHGSNGRTHSDMEIIEFVQSVCHSDHLRVPEQTRRMRGRHRSIADPIGQFNGKKGLEDVPYYSSCLAKPTCTYEGVMHCRAKTIISLGRGGVVPKSMAELLGEDQKRVYSALKFR